LVFRFSVFISHSLFAFKQEELARETRVRIAVY